MIVVLTLGRSGSSLIMQTLKTLGADVVGLVFSRTASTSHIAMNPGGYYEDGPLYSLGLKSRSFQILRDKAGPTTAFKAGLHTFLDDSATALWQEVAPQVTCVLLSIRTPCEQAKSETKGMKIIPEDGHSLPRKDIADFQLSTQFLKTYQQSFDSLQDLLSGSLADYHAKTHAIDYAQTRADALGYVRHIGQCAGLNPKQDQIAKATANIQNALYRHRAEDLRGTHGAWARALGAQASFERIKSLFG